MTTPYPPPPVAQPRRRRRPSAWWFAVGAALIAVGIALFVVLLVGAFTSFTKVDADVVSDGQPHDLTLAHTDEERMVWGPSKDGTDCTIVDRTTQEEVDYTPVTASYTKDINGTHYVGVVKFDPGSGDLSVSCQDAGGPIQIGPAPHIAAFAGSIVLSILILLASLGSGIVVLIVTGVLFLTGERRQKNPA